MVGKVKAFFVLIVLSCSVIGGYSKSVESSNDCEDDLELVSVHVISRHGARTPAAAGYPNDPYINDTYQPFGLGELTNVGRRENYNIGKWLRKRYNKFLGKDLKLQEIFAQSSEASRAKMTLQLLLAGLFPPSGTSYDWNDDLNWQPIGTTYLRGSEDNYLLLSKPCPRYFGILSQVIRNFFSRDLQANIEFYSQLSKGTGIPLTAMSPIVVLQVYGNLKSQKELGYKLPEWTETINQKTFAEQYAKSFTYFSLTEDLKKYFGGPFVKNIIADWDNKVNNVANPKFFIYGAHDLTVTTLLSAFNAWEEQVPAYGITAILELSQNRVTKEYGVEIFLRNSTAVSAEPYQLQIKGCDKYCSLNRVKELVQNNIPVNYDVECQAV